MNFKYFFLALATMSALLFLVSCNPNEPTPAKNSINKPDSAYQYLCNNDEAPELLIYKYYYTYDNAGNMIYEYRCPATIHGVKEKKINKYDAKNNCIEAIDSLMMLGSDYWSLEYYRKTEYNKNNMPIQDLRRHEDSHKLYTYKGIWEHKTDTLAICHVYESVNEDKDEWKYIQKEEYTYNAEKKLVHYVCNRTYDEKSSSFKYTDIFDYTYDEHGNKLSSIGRNTKNYWKYEYDDKGNVLAFWKGGLKNNQIIWTEKIVYYY